MAEAHPLMLYNTLTRSKEAFVPLDAQNVRMYVCGPTVYDYAHIGNARPVIVFDVLFRLLRRMYGDKHVTYVRNITDVDDKINARAAEEGVSIRDLTERTAKQFHADIKSLGVLPPTIEPRATDHIEEMKALIEALIANGNAYVAEGHVLFHVPSMPDYGRLSNRTLDEMVSGARVEVAPYKKDPMDFVLWKPSKEGEPSWPSPAGIDAPGRPGWHIECSAMAEKHLGQIFDIHGGGIDLVFPHHENEIAQSRCAHGTPVMARFWLHNGFLQVEGEKMSKSLGNFITIHDLLTEWNGYAWPGEALRFNMLRTHYRQPLDWTLHSLDESQKILSEWAQSLEGQRPAKSVPSIIIEALADDLNVPQVITELHNLKREGKLPELLAALHFLGFSGDNKKTARTRMLHVQDEVHVGLVERAVALKMPSEAEIKEIVATRLAARKSRNFKEADRIRDELAASGVLLKDAKDPATGEIVTTWELAR